MPASGEFPALFNGRRRIHEEHLLSLQDVLDEQLVEGMLDLETYMSEWKSLLKAAGYTDAEYIRLVEKRWDRLQLLKNRPVRRSTGN